MSEAVRFLHAFAHALATMSLYSPGHPAARRACDAAWEALTALLASDEHPIFFFLGGAPVYRGRALHEIAGWSWSPRLAQAGIQRLEFDRSVTSASFALALDRLMVRLTEGMREIPADEHPLTGVLYGAVAVEEEAVADEGDHAVRIEGSREIQLDLPDEIDAMRFLLTEARAGRVARAEAEAVTRILGGLLDTHALPQAIAPEDHAQYPAVHALNTALLVMAAGTTSGLDKPARHRLGIAALVHDIGMARLPSRLVEQESLSEEERALVETHTAEGARLLLAEGGRGFELAALVAWEHHLRPDGTGYPARRFRPAPHWASRLTGAAAAFIALRSSRPFRPAWSPERAVGYLDSGAGRVFDAEAARLIAGLVRPG